MTRSAIIVAGTLALAASAGHAQVRWPVANQARTHRLWHGYGTFQVLGSIHFHEGLDMPVAEGTTPDVLAAEDGEVVEIAGAGNNVYMTVQRAGNARQGWGYVHIDIGLNLDRGRDWRVGDAVVQGDRLGRVHDHTTLMDHLHFEHDNDSNGGWSATGARTADLNGDPLDVIAPVTDNSQPTLPLTNGHLRYRRGEDEGRAAATYFDRNIVWNLVRVISGNVDIIAQIRENFRTTESRVDYNINAKRVSFAVAGAAAIPEQTVYDFSGLFLRGDAPDRDRNSFRKFRDPARTQVVWEIDNTSESVGHSAGAGGQSANDGEYFYILTNKDNDDDIDGSGRVDAVEENQNLIELSDAGRFWDTNGLRGQVWNDNRDDAANEARNNATAAFPDGLYAVTVTARGLGSNGGGSGTVSDLVYVLNWPRAVAPAPRPARVGAALRVTGDQFLADTPYTAYVVRHRAWTDGDPIPSGDVVASALVTTDGEGRIPDTEIWSAYAPNGSPDVGYDVVIDYDGDNTYSAPIDHVAIDGLAFATSVCRADFNGDGTLDSDDFFDFANAFIYDDMSADFDGDGVLTSDDFFDFLNAYLEGC